MAPKSVDMSCRLIPMHVVVLVLVGLLILQDDGLAVNAQGANAAQRFLDLRELEVMQVAEAASANNANSCELLAGCSAECSREICRPLRGESRECVPSVPGSDFYRACSREGVGCRNMTLVDYSRSYIRVPAGASALSLQTEVAQDVCVQRRLDSTFKAVSDPSEYREYYFGSSSGAFRAFPGRESECTSTFDVRFRRWYTSGIISVSRDVKILVDVAQSMDQLLTADYKRPPGTSYLDVAKNMTKVLLHTLTPGDNVEVIAFDATNATSLGGALAVIDPYNGFNPNPELAGLVTDVNALAASSAAGASDLNGALRMASGSFNQIKSLKIVIVLSNGLFVVNSTSFPTAALQNYRAKLMVYKLPTNDDGGDPFLQRTPFRKDICSVQGSFELLDASATSNPLYSMRSHFTYLAGIQLIAAGGKVTWTNTYQDYSQVHSIVRPTYPAFGTDGLLLGVAGADVVLDTLDVPLRNLVWQELSRRNRAPLAPANLSMQCYYQTSIGPANWSCPPPDSSGICPQTDTSSTIADRTCCRGCPISKPAPLPSTNTSFLLGLAVIASLVGARPFQIFLVEAKSLVGARPFQIFLVGARPFQIFLVGARPFPAIGLAVIASLVGIVLMGCFFKKRSLIDLTKLVEEADPLVFYESIVITFGKQKATRNLFSKERIFLNERQCADLSTKLLKTIQNIREINSCCGAPANLCKPALGKLYPEIVKATLLVDECGRIDWYRAAVSQIHNEVAFQEILLDVGLCYNAIYEHARGLPELERKLPDDLRQSTVFMPASEDDVHHDQVELREALRMLASKRGESDERWLAAYLLERLNHPTHADFHVCSPNLWMKENIPTTFLGLLEFLRAGRQGVCDTKWMGIPCAKKGFHRSFPSQVFIQEARISAHFKHPCVVDFICCGNTLGGDRFIAMELMEKDLYYLIDDRAASKHPFSLPVVLDIMVQIARGMCYLHGQGVAHRDLKPHNVVVKTLASLNPLDRFQDQFEIHYCVKLADFGMSKTSVGESEVHDISQKNCGTTRYRAPEIHDKACPDGHVGRASWFKADAFSFAMTCAHMLTMKQPFLGIPLKDIYTRLMAGTRHELPGDCPPELVSLLKDCWTQDPFRRPAFKDILRRLEALRFKLFKGSRLQGKSHEFFQRKLDDYISRITTIQDEPLTERLNGVATRNEAIVISPAPSITETSTSHSRIEMVQSSQYSEGSSSYT